MRIGQTSLVVFLSKILGSIFGFVATVYFANVLGAEILGIYAVVIALVSWLKHGGRAGIGRAVIKRVSEGDDQGAYLAAGLIMIAVLGLVLTVAVFIAQGLVREYVTGFGEYVDVSVAWVIVGLLVAELCVGVVFNALHGQKLVHVVGLLDPVKIGVRSAIQIGLVFLGFGLGGLLVGYAGGLLLVAVLGSRYISIRPRLPSWQHFRSLFDYAKFSWLSDLKARAFNDVDVLVLGMFVSSNLIGVYSIAWSITKFLDLFGIAVGASVFPEISNLSAQESRQAATNVVEDALAYAGFIAIPGLVGGLLIADRLLRIYGSEFVAGVDVLPFLLLSILFFSFTRQFLGALNAIDRPDLAFRVNSVFVAANVVLNLALVWQLGWVGAAIASALSSLIGMASASYLLTRVLPVELPLWEVGNQMLAAVTMGACVWALRVAIETTSVIDHNFVIVCVLVATGIGVYVTLLLAISSKFRGVVDRNLPVNVSFLG